MKKVFMSKKTMDILTLFPLVGFFVLIDFFGTIPRVLAASKNSAWLSSDILTSPSGGVQKVMLEMGIMLFQIVAVLVGVSLVVSVGQYFFGKLDESAKVEVKHNLAYIILGGIVVLAALVTMQAIKSTLGVR